MSTRVTYNGIALQNVTTRMWQQEVVLDPSGTDLLMHRWSLAFEGIIHIQGVHGTGGVNSWDNATPAYVTPTSNIPATSAAAMYQAVQAKLSQPRGTLEVQFGNATVFQCVPTDAAVFGTSMEKDRDVNNGPMPKHVALKHIAGGNVFRVEFQIECCTVVCGDVSLAAKPGDVLSNRWAIEETMDSKFFTTRTIRGRLRLSHATVPGHWYKWLVVPNLENGFKRERLDFSVSENGLDCTWAVVDRQVMTAAPWPAVGIAGTYRTFTGDGVTCFLEMRVHLDGAPGSDPKALLARAVQIIMTRMNLLDTVQNANWQVEHAELQETIGEQNAVDASMLVRVMGKGGTDSEQEDNFKSQLGNVIKNGFGSPLDCTNLPGFTNPEKYDVRKSPLHTLYGYDSWSGERRPSVLFLLHCFLQHPCDSLESHDIAWVEQSESGEVYEMEREEPSSAQSQGTDPYPSTGDLWDSGHNRAMYTTSRVMSTMSYRDNRVHLPLARATSGEDGAPSSRVIAFGAKQGVRTIRFELERALTMPTVEAFMDRVTDGAVNATRIEREYHVCPPALSADGITPIYRVEGTITYAYDRQPKDTDNINLGRLPHVSSSASPAVYKLEDLTKPIPFSNTY